MLNVMGSFISTELDAFENLHKELEERDEENKRLKNIIENAIKKLEYYNSGEALYYVPIQNIIDILKGSD